MIKEFIIALQIHEDNWNSDNNHLEISKNVKTKI